MAHRIEKEPLNQEAVVTEFEHKLSRVRVLYEQYFLGIEKREPTIPLKDVVRLMRDLDKERINNTRLRYRYRSLVARFNTYRTYWHRTIRAINNGTYHRDVARLRRKMAAEGINVAMPRSGRMKNPKEVEKAVTEAFRQQAEQKKKGTKKPKHRKSPANIRGKAADDIKKDVETGYDSKGGGLKEAKTSEYQPVPQTTGLPKNFSDDKMRSLFRRYVKAKKMCGEDVSKVQYESLVRTVSTQAPKVQEVHKGREVDFDVVIRKGRVILQAKSK